MRATIRASLVAVETSWERGEYRKTLVLTGDGMRMTLDIPDKRTPETLMKRHPVWEIVVESQDPPGPKRK